MRTYRGESGQKWYEIARNDVRVLLIPEYNGGDYPDCTYVDLRTLAYFEDTGEEEPPEDIVKIATKTLRGIEAGKKSRKKPNDKLSTIHPSA